jgi:site-specific DNA-methyltransferase (adenine-specific)
MRRGGEKVLELNRLYNMDCMEGMKQFPDKYFELSIVDPPYGQFNDDKRGHQGGGHAKRYGYGKWDIAPNEDYFKELFRVSKNQIIWGGNYFALPPTRCFVVWRKLTISEGFTMAMCEYAWTSFNQNSKWIEIAPQNPNRIHPTQKPVALYKWLLKNYAKPGDKILDTHVGSASSLIACHNYGFEYIGFEIDKDYYEAAKERLDAVKSQLTMF